MICKQCTYIDNSQQSYALEGTPNTWECPKCEALHPLLTVSKLWYLYGIQSLRVQRNAIPTDMYRYKNLLAKEVIDYEQSIHYSLRNYHRMNEAQNAIKWNEKRITEFQLQPVL